MIEFTLRGVSSESAWRLPASKIYRFDGPDLIGLDGRPIARHSGGSWWADDVCYTTLYTESRCALHFENADSRSQTWGPYNHVSFADGMMRVGEADAPELLATMIDAFRQWAVRPDGALWRSVVLSSTSG
ncbi:MAG TPA: hypothetical protein VG433_08760 [Pirellulales bacterium]|jgi:hypothetical protein|nr:hypothetical protein [Pirellulales bacterium]